MSTVRFYDHIPADANIKYAVIVAQYQGKWILCRHNDRTTWEIPGGHRESDETPDEAAARELWEETGATKARIKPICLYSFHDFGMLYFAEIQQLDAIPSSSEIKEIAYFDQLPENLTYPQIQPALFEKVRHWLQRD